MFSEMYRKQSLNLFFKKGCDISDIFDISENLILCFVKSKLALFKTNSPPLPDSLRKEIEIYSQIFEIYSRASLKHHTLMTAASETRNMK